MIVLLLISLFTCPALHAAVIEGQVKLRKSSGETVNDASNVVVFVDGVDGTFKASNVYARMTSRDKEFEPLVLPVLRGTTVEFPNEDIILHNVFSLSKPKPFDLGLYKRGAGKSVRFDTSGLVRVYCNIHEKMVGFILVLDNPYFTVTAKDGAFKLAGLPAGKYLLKAWQRFGAVVEQPIEIPSNNKFTLELLENSTVEIHKNKSGLPYTPTY
jgi:plastocyanin